MRIRTQLAAIAAVALLGTLAACGGGDDDKAAEQPAAPDTSTGTSTGAKSPATGSDTAAAGAKITMKDLKFDPVSLTVKPGAKIEIINADNARHDLTDKKDIDSGDIEGLKNGSVTAPTAAGEYPYKCTYHFGMEGTLIVK